MPNPPPPDWAPALAQARTPDGRSLAELARDASVLVVFLRHFG